MKQNIYSFSVIIFVLTLMSACGSHLSGSKSAEMKGGRESGGTSPRDYLPLSVEDSKLVASALKNAKVILTRAVGQSSAYRWQSLSCDKSAVELRAPSGASFVTREISSCTFDKDSNPKYVKNEIVAAKLTKFLEYFGPAKQIVSSGPFPVTTWTVKSGECVENVINGQTVSSCYVKR